MKETAIRAEQLGKLYRIGKRRENYGTLRDNITHGISSLFRGHRSPVAKEAGSTFWALRDVSFEVQQGQAVGIIGRNGAGKSTLLKILTRITEPTEGYVELRGRVASLLEVGTGFHPELSGRENIYLNGAILGMRKAEIDRKFDEIVDFAEIETFLDTPVKRYSSGMYVRLAFAVAAHLEPEILLVDEVLAVGDAAFQKKCLGKMGDIAEGGRTILFVSHNIAAIQSLCNVAFLVDRGHVLKSGDVGEVVTEYLTLVNSSESLPLASRTDRQGNGRLKFTAFQATGEPESDTGVVLGHPAAFTLRYEASSRLRNVHVSLGFRTALNEGALYASNELVGKELDDLPAHGTLVCSFDKLPLLPGTYMVNVYCTVNGVVADWVADAACVQVLSGDYFGTGRVPPQGYGSVVVPCRWDLSAE